MSYWQLLQFQWNITYLLVAKTLHILFSFLAKRTQGATCDIFLTTQKREFTFLSTFLRTFLSAFSFEHFFEHFFELFFEHFSADYLQIHRNRNVPLGVLFSVTYPFEHFLSNVTFKRALSSEHFFEGSKDVKYKYKDKYNNKDKSKFKKYLTCEIFSKKQRAQGFQIRYF